jgi:hypothetical protein
MAAIARECAVSAKVVEYNNRDFKDTSARRTYAGVPVRALSITARSINDETDHA